MHGYRRILAEYVSCTVVVMIAMYVLAVVQFSLRVMSECCPEVQKFFLTSL